MSGMTSGARVAQSAPKPSASGMRHKCVMPERGAMPAWLSTMQERYRCDECGAVWQGTRREAGVSWLMVRNPRWLWRRRQAKFVARIRRHAA